MPSAGEKQPNPRRTPQPVTRRFAAIFRFFAGASGCSDSTGDGAGVVAGRRSSATTPSAAGHANRDLDPGRILSLSPAPQAPASPAAPTSWGPGRYDAYWNQDGISDRPTRPTSMTAAQRSLDAVVQHDDAFLRLRLDAREKTDLVEFLKSL